MAAGGADELHRSNHREAARDAFAVEQHVADHEHPRQHIAATGRIHHMRHGYPHPRAPAPRDARTTTTNQSPRTSSPGEFLNTVQSDQLANYCKRLERKARCSELISFSC